MKYRIGVEAYVTVEANSEDDAACLVLDDDNCVYHYKPFEIFHCEKIDNEVYIKDQFDESK